MNNEQIRETVSRLDVKKFTDQEKPWELLRPLGVSVVPYLLEAYPEFRLWQGRLACVYHSMRYARISEAAYQLGLVALTDRATLVRYRACGLLAYSLRPEAIPALKSLLQHPDEATQQDAAAAMKAIRKRNHHLFRDRDQTGIQWVLNPEDQSPR